MAIYDLDAYVNAEIARVRKLDGDGAPWVTGKRKPEDGIFLGDPMTKLRCRPEAGAEVRRCRR